MHKLITAGLLLFSVVAILILSNKDLILKRPIPKNAADRQEFLPTQAELVEWGSQKKVKLQDFQGKVLLINFWASWCEACLSEMPSIEALYQGLKPSGFEVLAINLDEKPEAGINALRNKVNISFPVFLDPENQLTKIFEVVAIPFSVVIDRNQKVVWSESGERDWSSDEVREEIQKLL